MIIAFIAGTIVGAILGFFTMALLAISTTGDES